jgi:hypothetical protein
MRIALASGREGNQRPPGRTEFNQILLESVNEAFTIALGRPITPELNHHLQAYIGLAADEMTSSVDVLFSTLSDSFGIHGGSVCKLVVKKMYEKAGVPFYEVAGTNMIQYVYELKRLLAMDEMNASSQQPKIHSS